MMKPSKCKYTKFFSSFYYVDLGGRNNFKLKVRKEKKINDNSIPWQIDGSLVKVHDGVI